MYASFARRKITSVDDFPLAPRRLMTAKAVAKRSQFVIYDEQESEEDQETTKEEATDHGTTGNKTAEGVHVSDETAPVNSATNLDNQDPVMSFRGFALEFGGEMNHPVLEVHLARFPSIDAKDLLKQTKLLQGDHATLKWAFVEHSPATMLQANAAKITELEVEHGGLNVAALWRKIYRFVPMMVGGVVDDARRNRVTAKFDELKVTFEEYKDALTDLRRILEQRNKGIPGFRYYGGAATYEIIGESEFE